MNFVMLVGISASAKSTIALEKYSNHVICSSDAIREELYGDASIQRDHGRVFNILHERIYSALNAGESVVYDATNLSKKRRIAFLKTLDKYGNQLHKTCVLALATIPDCITRDSLRERTVGEEVIMRQVKQFQPPYWDEGWNNIKLEYTSNPRAAKDWIDSCLDALNHINHDNPYHKGTIGEHIDSVIKILMFPSSQLRALDDVGKLHDIGKFYTKTVKDGIAHYYGHEYVSAYMSFFNSVDKRDIFMTDLVLRAYVISLHMKRYSFPNKELYGTFLNSLPEEVKMLLSPLVAADENGL